MNTEIVRCCLFNIVVFFCEFLHFGRMALSLSCEIYDRVGHNMPRSNILFTTRWVQLGQKKDGDAHPYRVPTICNFPHAFLQLHRQEVLAPACACEVVFFRFCLKSLFRTRSCDENKLRFQSAELCRPRFGCWRRAVIRLDGHWRSC